MTSFIYQDQELLEKLFKIAQQGNLANLKQTILKQLDLIQHENQTSTVGFGQIAAGDRIENHLGSLGQLSDWLKQTQATYQGRPIVAEKGPRAPEMEGFLAQLQEKAQASKNLRLQEQVGALISQARRMGMKVPEIAEEAAQSGEHLMVNVKAPGKEVSEETKSEQATSNQGSIHSLSKLPFEPDLFSVPNLTEFMMDFNRKGGDQGIPGINAEAPVRDFFESEKAYNILTGGLIPEFEQKDPIDMTRDLALQLADAKPYQNRNANYITDIFNRLKGMIDASLRALMHLKRVPEFSHRDPQETLNQQITLGQSWKSLFERAIQQTSRQYLPQ